MLIQAGLDDYTLNTEVNGNLLFPSDEGKSVVLVELKDMASIRDVLRAQGFGVETSIAAVRFTYIFFAAISQFKFKHV